MLATEDMITAVTDVTTEDIDEQELNKRCLYLHVGRNTYPYVTQAFKDGYFAGRKHSRDHNRMDANEFERLYWQGKLLETHPTPTAFNRYMRRVMPRNYTGNDADEWKSGFIFGWYSRVFHVDTCE